MYIQPFFSRFKYFYGLFNQNFKLKLREIIIVFYFYSFMFRIFREKRFRIGLNILKLY